MRMTPIKHFIKGWLIVLVALTMQTSTVVAQNCTISGPTEGCMNSPAQFTVNTQPGETVVWSTTTGQMATGGTAQFTFASPGTVTITVIVTTPGGSSCTKDVVFTINAAPTAVFSRLSAKYQCYSTNYYVFQDNSTPGAGRTLVTAEFLFGDGDQDLTTGPGGQYKHSYPFASGGYYTPFLRVTNDKGCVADFQDLNSVYVTPDIGPDFFTKAKASCGQTMVPIQNNSLVPYARVKKFLWDFGDGTHYESGQNPAMDSCYWSPTHIYKDHGCFDVMLIVQNDSNCWDTAFKTAMTRIPNNPVLMRNGTIIC